MYINNLKIWFVEYIDNLDLQIHHYLFINQFKEKTGQESKYVQILRKKWTYITFWPEFQTRF